MKWIILILIGDIAHGFDFFKNDIDFWKKGNEQSETKNASSHIPANHDENEAPKKQFDWSKHLDPKNEEFFREGDHLPPAPLMEVMRDPTDQNIKNWFSYIDMKNQIARGFHDRMQEYLALHPQKDSVTGSPQQSLPKIEKSKDISKFAKRFRFRFYFHSLCHHCQRMIETMNELQDQGFYIEGFVIDKNPKNLPPLHFGITPANETDLKSRQISSWPVLFVGDLTKQKVFRINGYKSTKEVTDILEKI